MTRGKRRNHSKTATMEKHIYELEKKGDGDITILPIMATVTLFRGQMH